MTGPDPSALQNTNNNIHGYLSIIKARFIGSGVRLIKVRPHRKEPLERNWTIDKTYSFEDHRILGHIDNGGNYGITSVDGSYAAVDADTKEIQDALDTKLPLTFRYSTGTEGHFQYWYEIKDPPIGCIPLKDGAYVKGNGGYALGPGSIHPNGTVYGSKEIRDVPIATTTKEQLLNALSEFLLRNPESRERPKIKREGIVWLSLGDLIDLSKFRKSGSQYQGPHPIHGSETGLNLSIDLDENVWHCFRHDSGGSVLEWIAVQEGIINCAEAIPGALRGEKFWKALEIAHEKYGLTKETAVRMIRNEVRK